MSGYVVTKGGLFGVIVRRYRSSLTGKECCVIKYGPLGWVAPAEMGDLRFLSSNYASEARAEAERWLAEVQGGAHEQG